MSQASYSVRLDNNFFYQIDLKSINLSYYLTSEGFLILKFVRPTNKLCQIFKFCKS